jgi:hypothetical protein
MMGMIFRSDTFEYLSAKAVNSLAMKAVTGVAEDPEMLMACSWRRVLATLALSLNFSASERLAIGPITLSHQEGKGGKSRTCKLICAAALSGLACRSCYTFSEVPAQQWEELAKEARAKVGSKPLGMSVAWRNPDVTETVGSSKAKKSETIFPRRLNGIPVAPCSRSGQRYCVNFQRGGCTMGDECQLGLHKCAALFKSGRTCHGKHPGSECWNTRKHALLEEGDPQEAPAQEEAKVEDKERPKKVEDYSFYFAEETEIRRWIAEETDYLSEGTKDNTRPDPGSGASKRPNNPGRASKGQRVITPEHVTDDSAMKELLPELSELRFEGRGNRLHPEPPRLVAKVCKEEGRGELWLGPLPTEGRMDTIIETTPSIQIFCFAKQPTQVTVTDGGAQGMWIPGTKSFRCEMSRAQSRSRDVRALMPCLFNSLRQGDNAYVHCISGVTRAPMAAALFSAKLMGVSFKEAQDIVNQTRHVTFESESHMVGPWIDTVLREEVAEFMVPSGFCCWLMESQIVVHATAVTDEGTRPICNLPLAEQQFAHNCVTVGSVEKAASEFGGRFCNNCECIMKASLQIQVKQFFG